MSLYCKGENTTPTQAGFTRAAGLSMPNIDPGGFTVMYHTYNVTARSTLYNTWFTIGRSTFGSGHYLVSFSSPVNLPDEMAMGMDGVDTFSGVRVVTGRWMCHAMTTREQTAGFTYPTTFYWDLPDVSKKITRNRTNTIVQTSDTRIQIGGTPWTSSEGTDSYIAGLKIWETCLSEGALLRESQSFWPVCPQYHAKVWCVVPGDVRDTTAGKIVLDKWKYGRHFTVYDGTNLVTTRANPPRVRRRLPPAWWGRYAVDVDVLAGGSIYAVGISLAASSGLVYGGPVTLAQLIALSAQDSLTPGALVTLSQLVLLAVQDAVSGQGAMTMSGSASLSAEGGVSDVGPLTLSLTNALAGVAGLSTLGGQAYAVTVGLALAAVLESFQTRGLDGAVVVTGQAGLTMDRTLTMALSQALISTAGLSASSALVTNVLVQAAVAASQSESAVQTVAALNSLGIVSGLSATGGFSFSSTVTLAGVGTVTIQQIPGLFLSLALGASSNLAATNAAQVAASVAMAIQASIADQAQQIATNLVSLGVSAGTAQAVAAIFAQSLSLSAAAAMLAQATAVSGAVGNIMTITAELLKQPSITDETLK